MASLTHASAPTRARRPNWVARLPWTGKLGLVMIVVFACTATFGPLFTPDAYTQNLSEALQSSSAAHWLGTDQLGRDLLGRIVVGARISLLIGLSATLFGIIGGGVIGALSGYFGCWFDTIVTRFMDTLIVFP